MDFGSLFHLPHHCGMGILGDLLAFFIQLSADFYDIWRNEAYRIMNPQHLGAIQQAAGSKSVLIRI